MVATRSKTNHFLETHNLPSSYPNCCFDCSVIASSIALTVVVARFFPGKRTFIEKKQETKQKKNKKESKKYIFINQVKSYIYIY